MRQPLRLRHLDVDADVRPIDEVEDEVLPLLDEPAPK